MVLEHKRIDLFNKMIFEKAVMVPPFRPPSDMPNEACFLYVLNGEQQTFSATQKIGLKSKDAILMKCGLYFTEWIASEQYQQCEAVAVHLYPEVLKKIYENDLPNFLNKKQESKSNAYKISGDALIDAYIQSLIFYFNNPTLVDDELIKLKLKELILLLSKTEKANSVIELISSLFSPKEYQFKEIIQANLLSSLSIEELAKFTNLSISSFKREFERIYNDAPARYIRNKKLEKSIEMLANQELRISEIAFECGFSDLAHYSKCFQEKYNTSPSAYRLNQITKPLD